MGSGLPLQSLERDQAQAQWAVGIGNFWRMDRVGKEMSVCIAGARFGVFPLGPQKKSRCRILANPEMRDG